MKPNPYCRLIAKSQWENGCLVFHGGTSGNGYGRFWFNGKLESAHRVAWELSGRVLIDGMTLDHICRNRSCINPQHLRQLTIMENVLAGNTLAAGNVRKVVCRNGHPLQGPNLIRYGKQDRKRRCRICANEASQRCRRNKAEGRVQ